MKTITVSLCCIVALVGCATVKESYGPDGRKSYSLNCSGTARGWDKCYTAAGELCGTAGYDVLARVGEEMSSFGFGGGNGSFGGYGAKTSERSMVISCKVPR